MHSLSLSSWGWKILYHMAWLFQLPTIATINIVIKLFLSKCKMHWSIDSLRGTRVEFQCWMSNLVFVEPTPWMKHHLFTVRAEFQSEHKALLFALVLKICWLFFAAGKAGISFIHVCSLVWSGHSLNLLWHLRYTSRSPSLRPSDTGRCLRELQTGLTATQLRSCCIFQHTLLNQKHCLTGVWERLRKTKVLGITKKESRINLLALSVFMRPYRSLFQESCLVQRFGLQPFTCAQVNHREENYSYLTKQVIGLNQELRV